MISSNYSMFYQPIGIQPTVINGTPYPPSTIYPPIIKPPTGGVVPLPPDPVKPPITPPPTAGIMPPIPPDPTKPPVPPVPPQPPYDPTKPPVNNWGGINWFSNMMNYNIQRVAQINNFPSIYYSYSGQQPPVYF